MANNEFYSMGDVSFEQMDDNVRMAYILDKMGFNMDRLEEDGSFKLSGNDLAFGEGRALGIFDENGTLDMKEATALLDTDVDSLASDKQQMLQDVSFLNQNVLQFAQNEDGVALTDTEEGQKLGDFLEKIDGVDDLEEFQSQNALKQKLTTADIVNGAMKNQDTLMNATIVLDADTMKAYQDFKTNGVSKEDLETEDELVAGENVENSVDNVDKSDVSEKQDTLPNTEDAKESAEDLKGVAKDSMSHAVDGVEKGLGAGLGVAAGTGQKLSPEEAARLREGFDNAREWVGEKYDQMREMAGGLKEDVSDFIARKKAERAMEGSLNGVENGVRAGLGAAGVANAAKDLGTDVEEGIAESVEGDVVSGAEDSSLYHNDGDTNVTINIYANPEQQMSMLDMAKMQMEQMGIDMSDEKNPEIPDWYDDMQKWVAERESQNMVDDPAMHKNLQTTTLLQKGEPDVPKQMPAMEGDRYEQAYERLGSAVDKANDAQAGIGMEL